MTVKNRSMGREAYSGSIGRWMWARRPREALRRDGGGKLMGSEDEVVGCIGEGKVKLDGEHRGWQYKWHFIFWMDSNIIDIKEQMYF